MISVTCACGKRLKADEKNAGRKAKCPSCGAPLVFPAAEPRAEAVPEAVPTPPGDAPTDETDDPAPTPEPVLAYDRAVARNRGRTSPPARPGRSEPRAYAWADLLAGLVSGLGIAQFILIALVAFSTMSLPPESRRFGGQDPYSTGELWMIVGQSFGLAVGSVLTASVVRVLLDIGQTLRQLLAEMRAK